MTLLEFLRLHFTSRPKDDLRLGQRFVNTYIKRPWPRLFYEPSDDVSLALIRGYLEQYQYGDEMPPELPGRNEVST